MKYCSKCGNELVDDAVICTKCGCMVETKRTVEVKSEKKEVNNSQNSSNANAIFSLIMGIISIIFATICIWSFVQVYFFTLFVLLTSILGLYFGIKSRLELGKGMSLAAIILASIALGATTIVTFIIFFINWWVGL